MAEIDEPRVPYPGLRPFEADEVDLFFGREQQVDGLLKRLSNAHFVAVVGESGAGKSSLVRAGLLPALEAGFVIEAGSDWRVAVMRPGGDPLTALANALQAPQVLSDVGGATPLEYALAELRRGPFGLVQMVRDAHLEEHSNLLVVVDQFEELFRYCREPAQKDQANIFVELLLEATAQRQVPVSVVLTMRSDFIGDCARFRGLPEKLNDNQFLTPRLTRDQIADAIRAPARVCGGTVERDLVDELCNAVGDNQDQLPLLQHLLMRVWERASQDSHAPYLTTQLAREMGGLHGALSRHAQQLYDSLPADSDRAIARAMFKSLTDPFSQRRDVRRDALVSEIAAVADVPAGAVIAVADRFRALGVHMLMPPPAVRLDAESRLDISHESLIRQWSMLSGLAAEEAASAHEFERLYEEAQRQQRDTGELLSGRSLAQAAEWFDHAKPTPAWVKRYAPEGALELTRTFVENSVAEDTRRKQVELQNAAREASAKRVKKYNWALSGLAVIAIVCAVASITLWRQAETQRQNAETQRQNAETAAQQAKEFAKQADNARTTATEAATEANNEKEKAVSALNRLHSSVLSGLATAEIPNDPSLAVLLARHAVFVDDARLRDRAGLALRTSIANHVPNDDVLPKVAVAKLKNYVDGSKTIFLEFFLSPSSLKSRSDLAIVPSNNHAIIWSTVSGERIRVLSKHTKVVGTATFSPNGLYAVTTSADNTACVWDATATTGGPLTCLGHGKPINGAVFSQDSKSLLTFGDDNFARVWNTDDYKLRCETSLHEGNGIASAGFTPDGKRLVTLEYRSAARVWDVGMGSCAEVTPPVLKASPNNELRSASYSPDGRWLGLVNVDGPVQVLDAASWKPLQPVALAKGSGDPTALAWSHDSKFFAVASGDSIGRLYSIDDGADGPEVTPVRELRGHTGRITSIMFSPKADTILTTSEDRTARLWKVRPDKRLLIENLVLRGHKDTVGSAVFSQNGNDVITASEDGTLRNWKPLFTLRQEWSPAKSPANSRLALNDFNGPKLLNDINGPKLLTKDETGLSVTDSPGTSKPYLLTNSSETNVLATSPGGPFVIAAKCPSSTSLSRCSDFRVWNVNAPKAPPLSITPLKLPGGQCNLHGISRTGDRLAWYCPYDDKIAINRSSQPGAPVTYGVGKVVQHIQFSYGSDLLAVTFDDFSVQIIAGRTEEPPVTMVGHTGSIEMSEFSRDDRFLATTSRDGTARVWDVATGGLVTTKQVPDLNVTSVSFSPDGLSLRLHGSEGLLLWRCYPCGDEAAILKEVSRRKISWRSLSPEEIVKYGVDENELNSAEPEASAHRD